MSVTTEGPWARAEQQAASLETPAANVKFSGKRGELFGRLLRGYLLMVPTLGLYRFWLTTTKRRFYWQNTVIGGERLEYTGSAQQLLVGFLFALGIFLPIYLAFFYLSFQSGLVTIIGYSVAALLLWFLAGYAIYRGRDFRLSRTLWRGVRLDQRGSALGYATRRFLWSLLVVVTAGLAFPFMAASLWRYRYNHTWYGDRQFGFTGSWKTIAGPYYRAWFVFAVCLGLGIWAFVASTQGFFVTDLEDDAIGGYALLSTLGSLLVIVAGGLCFLYYRSRETSRMFSKVTLGEASLTIRVKARSLLGQFILYALCLLGVLIIMGIIGFAIAQAFNTTLRGDFSAANLARAGWTGVVLAAGGYLATLSAFTLLGEVFIDCGYWMLVSRHAVITNLESLDGARASAEDTSVAGEGLADALNVGAF